MVITIELEICRLLIYPAMRRATFISNWGVTAELSTDQLIEILERIAADRQQPQGEY